MNDPMNSTALFDLAIRQALQLSALIVSVALVAILFCKRRPHLAYVLWMLVLLKAITPPIWSSPMGIFSWAETEPRISPQPEAPAPRHIVVFDAAEMISTPIPIQSAPPPVVQQVSGYQILAAIWAIGFAAVLGVMAAKWGFLCRRIARCETPMPAELRGVVEDVCGQLGVRTRIRVRVCCEAIGPAVFGFFRPTLVLPDLLLMEADRDDLHQIVSHEIIHIRRRDSWVCALQTLVQAAWWFHPLVWWMNRRVNEVREMCCDAEVIANQRCEAAKYAQMLLDVARSRRRNRAGFAVMEPALGAGGARMTKTRLEYIMSEKSRLVARMPWRYWIVFAVCALAILPGAGILRAGSGPAAVPSTRPANSETEPPVVLDNDKTFVTDKLLAMRVQQQSLLDELKRLQKEGTTRASAELDKARDELAALQEQMKVYADNMADTREVQSRPFFVARHQVRHFVMVVVGINGITFQGQPTTLDLLPSRLLDVPDPSHTVVQLAYASGDVTMRQFTEVQGRVGELVKRLGFEYLSLAGEHSPESKGAADQEVSSSRVRIISPNATFNVDRGELTLSGDKVTITTGGGSVSGAAGLTIMPSLKPAPISELTHDVKFELGQSDLTGGDRITITEVRGTSDQFRLDGTYQVKGTYTLASRDSATLALSVTAKDPKNGIGDWGASQSIEVKKGSGTFTLTERMGCEGYPHLSFYADGEDLGDAHFGTGDWVQRK